MQIETMNFVDDGDTPNHPLWPMMIYQTALVGRSGMAESFEEMFQRNGWDNSGWRNGIFRFLHYHSNAHEVLGIADGTARVRFGGANGQGARGQAGGRRSVAGGDRPPVDRRKSRLARHRRLSVWTGQRLHAVG